MGEQRVSLLRGEKNMQEFVRALLDDVTALEKMLADGMFEDDITRIGAEQEMVLVQRKNMKPSTVAMEAIESMKNVDWLETELAKFNLEITLTPHEFKGSCFRDLEQEVSAKLSQIQSHLDPLDAQLLLTGVLPTLRKFDLTMKNLTPKKRYKALMEAINDQLLGPAYELHISGIDELLIKHDSPFLEACNTSFQVHLQVAPQNFVKMYNIAQALAAPVMGIAANSPLVFGRRLWHESRIALFQQALDTRASHEHLRERSPRVNFGKGWLENSVVDIYKEDIARFRVLISGDVKENSLKLLNEGKVPKLRALQVHNSTVYRWNRPCYGISPNGKPHLRIENRVLPSGPTIKDEVANAVLWLGAMIGMSQEVDDITRFLTFADVRDNFAKAARFGMDSKFSWFLDKKVSAVDLLKNELIPLAEAGLKSRNVDEKDIDEFLGVIKARVTNHTNGARWMLRAYTQLKEQTTEDEALTVLTAAIAKNQDLGKGKPIHEWPLPELSDLEEYSPGKLKVSECMTTDLFTVREGDIIELVSDMMDWRKIRYMPVEDNKGHLVGLVTSRLLLRYFTKVIKDPKSKKKCVADIMKENPITITPDATIVEAMNKMRENKIGCLPVILQNELVGIITEMDFLRISGRLLARD